MSVSGARALVVALIALAAILVAVLLVAALPGNGGQDSLDVTDLYEPSLEKAKDDLGQTAAAGCRVVGKQSAPKSCVFGNPRGKRVLLFGDSHAMQWSPAIVPLAKKRGWRLMTLLRAGCPIAAVKTKPHCADWRRRALNKIPKMKPEHIIIATSIGGRYRIRYGGQDLSREQSESQLRKGMTRTVKRLKRVPSVRSGRGVILIRDQVKAPFVPAECLKENGGNPGKCAFPNKRRWPPGFDWIAAKRAGILPAVDPVKVLCGPKWCSPTKGRILKYRDSDHISATYARTLPGWFGKRLGIP